MVHGGKKIGHEKDRPNHAEKEEDIGKFFTDGVRRVWHGNPVLYAAHAVCGYLVNWHVKLPNTPVIYCPILTSQPHTACAAYFIFGSIFAWLHVYRFRGRRRARRVGLCGGGTCLAPRRKLSVAKRPPISRSPRPRDQVACAGL
jgi:hypothetical protein